MFHCTKRFSDRVKEKVQFRIQFHATQVPHLAWDRLAVFLIPLETGRVSSKTCKVPVQNGQCHWPRAVSETAKLVLDIRTLKYDEKLYKLVVGKGSRSDVLGEVITNLSEHISAACPTSVSLPLRFCYAGTVLHVTIQCLRDKPESRPSEWQRSIFEQECLVPDEAQIPLLRDNEKCNIGRHSSSFSRLQVPSCSPSSVNGHNVKTKAPILYISLPSPATPAQNDGYPIGSFESCITSSTLSSSTGSSFKGQPQDLQNGINTDFEDLEGMHDEAFPWKSYAQRLQAEIEMQEEHFANAKLKFDIEQSSFVAASELEHFKRDNEHYRLIIENLKEELAFEKGANANLNIELQKMRDSNMSLHSAVGDLEDSLKMQIKQTKYVDEEREAYLLESYVFENLVRELCEQLQTFRKARDEDDITTKTQNQCECKEEESQEEACEIEHLRDEAQRLKEQTTTLLQENETLASKALVETERHQAEKKEWYDKFIEMEVMLKQSEAGISSTKTEVQEMALQCRASEAKELETSLRLDVVSRKRERSTETDEAEGFLIWKIEKQKLLDEILRKSVEVEILKTEVANFMENLKNEKIRLGIGLQKLNGDRAKSQEQNASLEKKISTLEAELENCKSFKATLEEQVICLQTKLQVECVLGAEARNDCKQLRKENQDLRCELFESNSANSARSKLEGELLNLQKRMEAELDSLVHDTELQLVETMECLEVGYEQSEEQRWAFLHTILGGLGQCNHAQSDIQASANGSLEAEVNTSKQAIVTLEENMSRLQSQLESECERLRQENQGLEHVENLTRNLELLRAELSDFLGMVAYKEDVRSKELESIKQEFEDREALLWKRIELLEMANEQLAEQQVDSGGDQLKRELTRLQTHNSELIRREGELMSKLRTYELLQLELRRLQEANEQLEQKLLNVKEASLWGDALEKLTLTYLEAESLETNKLQLQSILAMQHNVGTAVLHVLGNVDEILSTMICFKNQASSFEAELNKLQDMCLHMSTRLTEIQAEKEELVVAVKALQSGQNSA